MSRPRRRQPAGPATQVLEAAAGQPPVRDEQEGRATAQPPPRSGPPASVRARRRRVGAATARVTSSRSPAWRRRRHRRGRGPAGSSSGVVPVVVTARVEPVLPVLPARAALEPGRLLAVVREALAGPPLGPNPVRPTPASRSSPADACPRANPPAPAIRATPTAPPASSSRPRLRFGAGAGAYAAAGAAGGPATAGGGGGGAAAGVSGSAGCSHREPLTGWVSSSLMGTASRRALSGGVGPPVRTLCVGRRPVRRRPPPWRPRSRA